MKTFLGIVDSYSKVKHAAFIFSESSNTNYYVLFHTCTTNHSSKYKELICANKETWVIHGWREVVEKFATLSCARWSRWKKFTLRSRQVCQCFVTRCSYVNIRRQTLFYVILLHQLSQGWYRVNVSNFILTMLHTVYCFM